VSRIGWVRGKIGRGRTSPTSADGPRPAGPVPDRRGAVDPGGQGGRDRGLRTLPGAQHEPAAAAGRGGAAPGDAGVGAGRRCPGAPTPTSDSPRVARRRRVPRSIQSSTGGRREGCWSALPEGNLAIPGGAVERHRGSTVCVSLPGSDGSVERSDRGQLPEVRAEGSGITRRERVPAWIGGCAVAGESCPRSGFRSSPASSSLNTPGACPGCAPAPGARSAPSRRRGRRSPRSGALPSALPWPERWTRARWRALPRW
jgi:hypothetical protein